MIEAPDIFVYNQSPPLPLVKVNSSNVINCFMLKGSLDIFRKSHVVSAVNFDPIGVKLRFESDPGHYDPPVRYRVY